MDDSRAHAHRNVGPAIRGTGSASAGAAPHSGASTDPGYGLSSGLGGAARDQFAVLRAARRVWAISAVHAEVDALADVHRQIDVLLRPGDRVVYLGSLIGWGNATTETIDEALRFRRSVMAREDGDPGDVAFLRGAQEEMWQKLLQLQFAANPSEVLRWMLDQGMRASLEAYGGDAETGFTACARGPLDIARWTHGLRAAMHARPGHADLFSALRRCAFTDDGNLLFVHAGLDPREPIERQGDVLWWGGGFSTIREPYGDFRMVIRGFDRAHAGVQTQAYASTIDGGCGFGGPLLAGCFDLAGRIVDLVEGSPHI